MIAKIENYSIDIDLRLFGCQEEGTLDYEAMGKPYCVTPSEKLYLDAVLHHAQAFVDKGVYPLVVVFLPKSEIERLTKERASRQ